MKDRRQDGARSWSLGACGLWGVALAAGLACSTTDRGAPNDLAGSGATPAVGGGGSGGLAPSSGGSGAVSSGGQASGGAPGGGAASGGISGTGAAGSSSGGQGGQGTGGLGAGGGSSTGGAAGVSDAVTRSDSTFTFHHFPIETNSAGVWNGPTTPAAQAIDTTYETIVLENGYLKVTLLPSYGGRILSIIHKPTGRELLYQNPIGTPYLMQQDIFYYDYLVIMGGIFPSFPEPEHGRYWNQPYDVEVVSETPEAITVRMSRQDDLDVVDGVPARYDVGRTDLRVELDVTLRAGRSDLELSTKLTNPKGTPIAAFEYWTVTTLAPGSVPGATAIPLNTRILADMAQVHLLESSWAWFGNAEERVTDEVFKWNNLAHFSNWVDQGTAFANPRYETNWSGLANDDAAMATLRASDNVETPGLKLWTFGQESLTVDINDPNEWLRPTIEMWHGVTPEFWARGTMAAGEVRQWSDHYFLALGLNDVTAASEYGAMSLSASDDGADTQLTAIATLTLPTQNVKAQLRLDGQLMAEQQLVVSPTEKATALVKVPSAEIAPGAIFQVEFLLDEQRLLAGQIVVK